MSFPTDPSFPFAISPEVNVAGTSTVQQPAETGQAAGPNPTGGPSIQTPVPTQADLLIAQLAEATVTNTQLQQENIAIMKKMQEMIESLTLPKHKKITVSAPKSFDGKPKNYPAFVSSLVTQFRADPHTYSTPHSKIWYALSHMKDGIAELWARRMIEGIESGAYKITTWDDFEGLMRLQFDSVNRKLDAQRAIASFKQGSKTAEEFFTQFEDYKADAGFGEETIIFFLKDNLNPGILSKIVFMPNQPKTYDEFKKAAYFFDRQYRENKERTKSSTTNSSNNTSKPKTNTSNNNATPSVTVIPQPSSPLDSSAPMDVDRLRAMANKYPDTLCYNCNRKGHYASSCPEPRKPRHSSSTTTSSTTSSVSSGSTPPATSSSNRAKPERSIRQMFDDLNDEEKSDFIRGISQDFLSSSE